MKLSIVVPVYEEEGNIPVFLNAVERTLVGITDDYEIIFSVDPSRDKTVERIAEERNRNPRIKYLVFSRRIGQPLATLAGLEHAEGDPIVVMDVDLQDPPELMPKMIEEWQHGYDVVYAVRASRGRENLIKKIISFLGYRAINKMSNVDIPSDTGDFRLMSSRVVNELNKMKESHGYLRGMVAVVGFKQTSIQFDRPKRNTGRGKYNRYFGSMTIGINGLVGFSKRPLFVSTIVGLVFALSAVVGVVSLVISGILDSRSVFTEYKLEFFVLFLAGIQLISIGIVGEYIGRIYDEVKKRPRYIIDQAAGFRPLSSNAGSDRDEIEHVSY